MMQTPGNRSSTSRSTRASPSRGASAKRTNWSAWLRPATALPSPRSSCVTEETRMPIPNNALVLVVDGRKMLFFRNQGDENQIDLRTEAHDEREDAYNRDIKTDAQGTASTSSGFG